MVRYQPADVLAMTDFALAWRINDARWSAQPEALLGRIKPLSPARSRMVYESAPRPRPFGSAADSGPFQTTRHRSLVESGTDDENERVRQWFRALPIAPAQEVYLSWGPEVAAVTDWDTVVAIWDDLWYPFDRLCVFDESRNWVVSFGPEEDVSLWEPVGSAVSVDR